MGFRDDLEATTRRADTLERDLEGARVELDEARQKVASQESELDRLRARLRSLGVTDVTPPQKTAPPYSKGMGLTSIILGMADLGFLGSIYADWPAYVAEDHEALIARGRDAYIELATYADTAEWITLAIMSVVVCVIGVGLLLGHRWTAPASIVWGAVALAFNVFTALSIDAIHGTISEDGVVGGAIMTAFPLVMIVYGIVATWRLTTAPWSPPPR